MIFNFFFVMFFNNYVNFGLNLLWIWNLCNVGIKEKYLVFVWFEILMKCFFVWYFIVINCLLRKLYIILVFIESMIKCLKKNIKCFFWGNCFEIMLLVYLVYFFMILNFDDFVCKIWNIFIVILFYSCDEIVKVLISLFGYKIWK